MDFKTFAPGEVFTAADANNLLSGGRIVVDTAAQLPTGPSIPDRLRAFVRATGRTYTYIFQSLVWQPDDTDWTPFVLASEVAASYNLSQNAAWRRIGEIVYIRGLLTKNTGTLPAANTYFAALPTEARPHGITVCAITNDGQATAPTGAALRIEPDGQMSVAAPGGSRTWLNTSYIRKQP